MVLQICQDRMGNAKSRQGYELAAEFATLTQDRMEGGYGFPELPLNGAKPLLPPPPEEDIVPPTQPEPDNTVGRLSKKFLEGKADEVSIGNLSAGRYDTVGRSVEQFRDFCGATTKIEEINGQQLFGYHA